MYKTITAVALFVCLNACKQKINENTATDQPVCISDSLSGIIRIDTAVKRSIDDELKLSGEISFDDNKVVKVYPFSSGQVQSVLVSLGDRVKKGQTLAIIKSADVAGNYADLSAAGNDVAIAKKQMDNAESLFKNGIASEKEYTEAKSNYEKALTGQTKLREQININGGGHTSASGEYVLKSPMDGYVVEKKINAGSFIRSDNADNLFTVGDINDVWVWANVYESDIAKIKEGYTATVTTLSYPDTSFTGIVDKVNQILDPETKVMRIRIRLPNKEMLLKPEMFANILIEHKQGKQAVTIPSDALISDNGKNFVIIYHDRCKLEIKEVTVLKNTREQIYLSEGLSGGEQLVCKNQILLFNALKEN